jgi:hypothetical protein
LRQVQKDEQLLANALSQTDGNSLELLRHSRTYTPFFLEAPGIAASASMEYQPLFRQWESENGQSFLPGGYIYRIRFADAATLYATSSGDWGGLDWYSIDLGKIFEIEPSRVWSGSGEDYLYATTLTGVPPRIVVYDEQGEVKRKEAFDVTAANLEQRVEAAEKVYAGKRSPVLEMLSLGEYLENPDASWRELDLSGRFNLRNQHESRSERERLKHYYDLSRSVAVEMLKSMPLPESAQRAHVSAESMPHASIEESLTSARKVLFAFVIIAALWALWSFIKTRR